VGAFLYQEKGKRVLETELRDQQRVAALGRDAQEAFVRGERAKSGGDLHQAKDFLGQALAKIDREDSLTELVARIRDSLAEVDQQLVELAARQDTLDKTQRFWRLYSEAMFQGTVFTGGDLPTSVAASRRAARDALALFGMAPETTRR